jgi:hypothetical protein
MGNLKFLLVSSVLLLLLVGGASAITFVINDGDASLALSATPNKGVAITLVVAEEPASYSATVTADDRSGAAVTQESNIEDADYIFSSSAAISPDGDSSYTLSETREGSTHTSQTAQANQGGSASASQQTASIAAFGSSVVNATDSHGNTVFESDKFLIGMVDENLSASTEDCVSADLSGTAVSVAADTHGVARSADGDISGTGAHLLAGLMTFNNAADATGTATTASQDVLIAGLLGGSAGTGSLDQNGNLAFQGTGFSGGILTTDQAADTLHSANAVQIGSFIGAGAMTTGFTEAADGDISSSNAGVLAGVMSFDNGAAARDYTAATSQDVLLAGLNGSAQIGSRDNWGKSASESSEISYGSLDVTQSADTSASASADQTGVMVVLGYGETSSSAMYKCKNSWTSSNVTNGTIIFDADAESGVGTSAEQTLASVLGSMGSTEAGSSDGTNYAYVGSGFKNGGFIVPMYQEAETTATNVKALQAGTITSSGTTLGDAWTRSEAGNTSGRLVYIEEDARTKVTPGTVTLVVISNASADNTIAGTQATTIIRSPSKSSKTEGITTAYAYNGAATTDTSDSAFIVNGKAWATNTNRYANV